MGSGSTFTFSSALTTDQTNQLATILNKIVQFVISLYYTILDFCVSFISQNSMVSVIAVLTILGGAYVYIRSKKQRLGIGG